MRYSRSTSYNKNYGKKVVKSAKNQVVQTVKYAGQNPLMATFTFLTFAPATSTIGSGVTSLYGFEQKSAQAILKAYRSGTITLDAIKGLAVSNPRFYAYVIAVINSYSPAAPGAPGVKMIELDVEITKMTVDELIKYVQNLLDNPAPEPELEQEPETN